MKFSSSRNGAIAALCLATGALLPAPATAQSTPYPSAGEKWQFAATIYGYLPSIGGKLSVPVDSASTGLSVSADQIIDSLKMTFMGTLDAHNGRWGAFTDVLYLDVGGNKSQTRDFSVGGSGLPASTTADVNLDLKGTVWTIAGEYRVISDPAMKMDILAGARYFGIKPTLGWSIQGDLGPIPEPGRSGSKEIDETVWDGIVGVKGAYAFGADRRWSVPFYFDIGTGQSDLTWQAAAGVAYSYHWGDLVAMWRYVDYNFKSDKNLQDMNFNGPMFGATFRW
ncbi:MAG: hypothetical protein IPO82_01150 [Betaproteobacteria bacterium]|jgi:hypothetical protein|nr:hypothetical protein [Betaproteobacteria bacterium]